MSENHRRQTVSKENDVNKIRKAVTLIWAPCFIVWVPNQEELAGKDESSKVALCSPYTGTER